MGHVSAAGWWAARRSLTSRYGPAREAVRDDKFPLRVMSKGGRARHDEVGVLPRTLLRQERDLLGHPGGLHLFAYLAGGGSGCLSPLDLGLVSLNPHEGVKEGPQQVPPDADAFDDNERTRGRSLDGPRSISFIPGWWTEPHRLAPPEWLDDACAQDVVPPEDRVVPRHIVGVDDRAARHDASEPLSESALATRTAAVDTEQERARRV